MDRGKDAGIAPHPRPSTRRLLAPDKQFVSTSVISFVLAVPKGATLRATCSVHGGVRPNRDARPARAHVKTTHGTR